jgi:hypothetical protein
LAGVNYDVIIGGTVVAISGTSASSPAIAGMISTINAARIAQGKGSVGFFNPALYMYGDSFVNDITEGNIFCAGEDGTCCPQGFYAAPGWDPTTGLGTVNYGKMADILIALGQTVVPTSMPVVVPIPVPAPIPATAPVAAGSLLTGYYISASYSDTACQSLRYSNSVQLNTCVANSDSTYSIFTATSTDITKTTYSNSACTTTVKVLTDTYANTCSMSSKNYVSTVFDPPSTAPTVFYR